MTTSICQTTTCYRYCRAPTPASRPRSPHLRGHHYMRGHAPRLSASAAAWCCGTLVAARTLVASLTTAIAASLDGALLLVDAVALRVRCPSWRSRCPVSRPKRNGQKEWGTNSSRICGCGIPGGMFVVSLFSCHVPQSSRLCSLSYVTMCI